MAISISISQEHEKTLRAAWGNRIDQAAFDGLLIESYRAGRLSAGEVAELLGLGTSLQAIAWLSKHGVPLNYTFEDLRADRRILAEDFPESKR